MIVHTIHDLSNKYVVDILVKGLSNIPEQDLAPNYHPEFNQDSANLFYILKNNRYINGSYYVLEEDDKFIAAGGWNHYTDDTALILTRMYVVKEYRTKNIMSTYFLPKIFEETSFYKKLWITCNEYNKALYDAFVLMSNGKKVGYTYQWPEIFKIFKPLGTKLVNNTPQYVVEYERTL
jgi:hypothetical protein